MTDLHFGDAGTILRFTVIENGEIVDVSSGSAALKIRTKNKDIVVRDMEFYTDGTDGIFQYRTIDGDIDENYGKGKWVAQLHLVLPGWIGHSSTADLEVDENVDSS